MKYGYARVSTDGQSVDAQVRQLTKAGCKKVFREVASGAKTDRTQLRKTIVTLEAGDVLTVTRLDRLARSTRDLLNTLAAIADRKVSHLGERREHFRSILPSFPERTFMRLAAETTARHSNEDYEIAVRSAASSNLCGFRNSMRREINLLVAPSSSDGGIGWLNSRSRNPVSTNR